MRCLPVIAGALAAAVVSMPVWAINMNKPRVSVDLKSGGRYSDAIVIDNPGRDEVQVRVYYEDFEYKEPYTADKEFFPPYSSGHSLAGGISYSPQEFVLPPYGSQRIDFMLEAPADFSTARCGVLFFETSMGGGFDSSGKAVQLLSRVGTLFFMQPAGVAADADLQDVTGGTGAITATLVNTGKRFIKPTGSYYVMDARSMAVDRGSVDVRFLMPGAKAQVTIPVPSSLAAGEYFMVLTYNLDDDTVIVREIDFSIGAEGAITIADVRR